MVAALIITLWSFRSRLTYDNFRYLFRDIDEAGRTSLTTDAVYFTANDTNVHLYFKGDLAVGSSDGVSFHRSLGSRSFEDSVKFKAPKGFDTNSAELIVQNYADVETNTLKPYETRVYLWNK